MKIKNIFFALLLLFISLNSYGFYQMHSYHNTSPISEKITLSFAYDRLSYVSENHSESIFDELHLGVSGKINDYTNLEFRFTRLNEKIEDFFDKAAPNVYQLGVKHIIVPGRFGFVLPFSIIDWKYFSTKESMSIKPELILSWDINKYSKLSLCPYYKLYFNDRHTDMIGFNVNVSIDSESSKYTLYPEIGWLFNTSKSRYHLFSFGVGISFGL